MFWCSILTLIGVLQSHEGLCLHGVIELTTKRGLLHSQRTPFGKAASVAREEDILICDEEKSDFTDRPSQASDGFR